MMLDIRGSGDICINIEGRNKNGQYFDTIYGKSIPVKYH